MSETPLLSLLYSSTPDTHRQALELMRSLNDPALWAQLWAELRPKRIPEWAREPLLLGMTAASPPGLAPARTANVNLSVVQAPWSHAGLAGATRVRVRPLCAPGTLQVMPELPAVEQLYLNSCVGMTDLRGLERFPTVRCLTIRDAWSLTSLDGIEALPALEEVRLFRLSALRDIRALQGLPRLRRLTIRSCGEERSPLAVQLSTLRTLTLWNVPGVTAAWWAGSPLTRLMIRAPRLSAADLQALAALDELTDLTLFLWELPSEHGLGQRTGLRHLRLRLHHAQDVRFVASLQRLRTLELRSARLSGLPPLSGLRALRDLRLDGEVILYAQRERRRDLRLWSVGELELPLQLEQLTLNCGWLVTLHGIERPHGALVFRSPSPGSEESECLIMTGLARMT